MVDVIRSTGIEYIYANPASSYRGIHESLINYGGNTKPEFIECMHEESSIAMAHGYYKATGKLAAVLVHGTVGLMHGTMAIYNAWCDRAPVMVMGGNDLDAAKRPPGVPTTHSAQDINALVRDFTKWDDTPVSLQHFAQSFVRAAKFAMTPPHEPVMLTLDAEVQESPIKEHERNTLYHPEIHGGRAAPGRGRRVARGRQDAGQCREPGDRGRPGGAHRRRRQVSGRAGRAAAGTGRQP